MLLDGHQLLQLNNKPTLFVSVPHFPFPHFHVTHFHVSHFHVSHFQSPHSSMSCINFVSRLPMPCFTVANFVLKYVVVVQHATLTYNKIYATTELLAYYFRCNKRRYCNLWNKPVSMPITTIRKYSYRKSTVKITLTHTFSRRVAATSAIRCCLTSLNQTHVLCRHTTIKQAWDCPI